VRVTVTVAAPAAQGHDLKFVTIEAAAVRCVIDN